MSHNFKIVLVFVAGFMSGMTIGLASIDKLDLEIKKAITIMML